MGLHDRDYARNDRPGYGYRPEGEAGAVTPWLIGLTVAVFLLQLLTNSRQSRGATEFLELNTALVWQGQVWRLITHGFVHSTIDIWHIVFNMLGLFFFGRAVEERYGGREFLAFYLVAIFLGGLAFLGTHWNVDGSAVGASAGVTAVLILFACTWPRQQVLLFFVIPVQVWVIAVLFVAIDALTLAGAAERRRIAVEAHLAGATFAFLYFRYTWHLTGWYDTLLEWRKQQARPRLRVYDEATADEPPITKLAASLSEEEQLEAKVDAVLEKLSRVGQENLTPAEKEILQRASEVFRKRRG